MAKKQSTKIYGVICSWGYVESSMAGFDVWRSDGYFEDSWTALQSLSAYFYRFYTADVADKTPDRECCAYFVGKTVGDILKDDVMPEMKRHAPLGRCLECGSRLEAATFDPEDFSEYLYGQYTLQCHEQPFWDDESWERSIEGLFQPTMRDEKHWVSVWYAEQVLVCTLPVDELEFSDDDKAAWQKYFDHNFDRLDKPIKALRPKK